MEVPSITSVNPQGAAHKIGVLLKGDRVLAINGRNTFGLTAGELESLKEEAFGSEEILLVIEFDIAVRE
ncbi:glutamate receptor-interacting protein 2, partial [Caerostris darwini]